MQREQNERITRVGPGTPCGELLRRYWHPVALLDEFDPALDPRMAVRPAKPVRLLGEDLILFRDDAGRFGLLDRACPHRGADLAYGRHEGDGLRCPFHGWKFDADGRCLETPAEPLGSTLCERVRATRYPLVEKAGVLFAWLGPEGEAPAAFPDFDCFAAPSTHSFAFKGLWRCNWLQAVEVGIDPSHTSFLHRFFSDGSLDDAYGKQFRNASVGEVAGERWPMSRIMREFHRPEIRHEPLADGLWRITTLRRMNDQLIHVRITNSVFPNTFVIPLSETITITQMHVPVDDTHVYWYSFFTSFDAPLDKAEMRRQRLIGVSLPDYLPLKGRHNEWGYDPVEQRDRTMLGMGEADINVHDQWACESMGPIADRTKEHLGTSDRVIMANRRELLKAIDTVASGGRPPMSIEPAAAAGFEGPVTIDCIAPADRWEAFWREQVDARRSVAAWRRPARAGAVGGTGAPTPRPAEAGA